MFPVGGKQRIRQGSPIQTRLEPPNRPTLLHRTLERLRPSVLPAFLADAADAAGQSDVLRTLRFRSYDLYGHYPEGEDKPREPPSYLRLNWLSHPEPVRDLEGVLREQLAARPTTRAAVAARPDWLAVQRLETRRRASFSLQRSRGKTPTSDRSDEAKTRPHRRSSERTALVVHRARAAAVVGSRVR